MADPPPCLDTDDAGVEPDPGSTTGTPRWMLVVGVIIAILLILGFVVLHLTGALGPGAHS